MRLGLLGPRGFKSRILREAEYADLRRKVRRDVGARNLTESRILREADCRLVALWSAPRPVHAGRGVCHTGQRTLQETALALIAQLDRASVYGTEGQGFESL